MEHYLTEAEQLYNDQRYEEALAVYEQAIRENMPDPDLRLYYGRAAVLKRLAERAYEMAKQYGYREDQQEEATPSTMSLPVLASYVTQELKKYRRGEPSNDEYCLELFRRTMVLGEGEAWNALLQCFGDIVRSWIQSHPHRRVALRLDEEENYVARTFERFWLAAVHAGDLQFSSTASALSYLRACLNGAILDTLRFYSRAQEQPLPEPDSPDEPVVEEPDNGHEVWAMVQHMLPDERERRLAYLLLHSGLKPREIIQHYPEEFGNVQEVNRLRQNIIDRLARKAGRIRWLLSDET